MGGPNKSTSKNPIIFYILLFFSHIPTGSSNTIPTSADIHSLAERTRLTAETFMRESFKLRMGHEFSGRFLSRKDKDNLYKLAKRASGQLQAIAQDQQKLKQQIEDYQGDDWDNRYGSTGLWRKLFGDLYTTNLNKCEIDFYAALSSEQPNKNKILHKILTEIDSLSQIHNTAYAQFLKAKSLSLLTQTDPIYKPVAKKEFDILVERSDIKQSTAFKITVERIKLFGPTRPDQLRTMTENIANSKCKDDLELVVSLVSLWRRFNKREGFEKTVKLFPQAEELLGYLILSDLSHQFSQGQLNEDTLRQISVFEAELAVQAAWKKNAEKHKTLLENLARTEKLQTSLILYVAATSLAESSPAKSVNLLIEASNLRQLQKNDKPDIEAYEIAKQAAQLAYNLCAQDLLQCQLALKAFENYCKMTGEGIEAELEYLYTIVLGNCGRAEEATKLLQTIADRPTGNWRNRARLDLIMQAIEEQRHKKQGQRSEILKQLSVLIADCTGANKNNDQLRAEAITLYCKLLLESEGKDVAQQILNTLTEADTTRDPNLYVFKSKALRRLGRLNESAHYLLKVSEPNSYERVSEAMELLAQVIDEIDTLQIQTERFPKMAQDFKKLAQLCYESLDGQRQQQAGLYLVEIIIFTDDRKEMKLPAAERLLRNLAKSGDVDNIDSLRCRARLLTELGKFNEASELWAQIAGIRRGEMRLANKRSRRWWRARFYELYCLARRQQTRKETVLHTIEVLESSFTDIPHLWAEKLKLLKQQCHQK